MNDILTLKLSIYDIFKINFDQRLNLDLNKYKIIYGYNWFVLIPNDKIVQNYNSNFKENHILKKNGYKKLFNNTCEISKINFYSSQYNSKIFPLLEIYIKCSNCGSYFKLTSKIDRLSKLIESINNSESINRFCSRKCSKIFNINQVNKNYSHELRSKNSKININKVNKLWKNKEWAENQRKNIKQNLQKANEIKLGIRLKELEKLKINFNYKEINYQNLNKNIVCGSYVLKGKFKFDNDNNKYYDILICKSSDIYSEIRWILRVLSQPEKQEKNNPDWTIAKWWYISNLYYNFKFILLTNENGIPEKEALLVEAKYGFDNNMICNKEQIFRDGYSKTHSYWSL